MRPAEKQSFKINSANLLDTGLTAFLEICPVPLALWDGVRRNCLFNASSARLLGFSRDELQSKPQLWNVQVHAADLIGWRAQQIRMMDENCPVTCDYRFYRKDATSPIWLRENVVPIDLPNTPWRSISMFTDISDLNASPVVSTQTSSAPQPGDTLRALFHDVNNKLQRLGMEIELAMLESQIQPGLGRKFTDALLGVNQALAAIQEQCRGAKTGASSSSEKI